MHGRNQFLNSVKASAIHSHLGLAFLAVAYLVTNSIWALFCVLIFGPGQAISTLQSRFLLSKFAAFLALCLISVYPVYFWSHLKQQLASLFKFRMALFCCRMHFSMGMGKDPNEEYISKTIDLNSILTGHVLEENKLLRDDVKRCMDLMEAALSRPQNRESCPQCPVCLMNYDITAQKTMHVMECGHHVCQTDIRNCTKGAILVCPICRHGSQRMPTRVYL